MVKSWGNVILKDPKMTLTTDTLHFDRTKQILLYKDHATIKDSTSTLKSQIGNYFLETKKFQALSKVTITTPDNTITSEHLDYFTDTGIADLYGPTTIVDLKENNTLYCKKGHHNSKTRISHFIKNAKITYQDRIIEGDSLYYDENRQFASATGNIIVTDTINNSIIKGGYAEYFEAKDSVFIIDKSLAITLVENDSTYIHGDTLLVTGKQDERIIRAYHHVKFFKKDLQGKCDSLYSNEATGLTKMYRRPILWNDVNQITGDTIHFLSNKNSSSLDSLKVYNNAFVIKKDSSGGFSQIKGKNLYGKFVNDTLDNIRVSGNGQMINYNRNEKKELIAITKMTCSNMEFIFNDGNINLIKYLTKPEGKT
jgi:lipopolysaccharide export system protein LptA